MNITVRPVEPDDYKAVHQIYTCPSVVMGTLQLPLPSVEMWRKRLAQPREGAFSLVACIDADVVGHLGLRTFPNHPRRRHAGQIGIAVHQDWQGKGVGTALMEAMIDLADQWLNLTRLELEVFVDNAAAIHLYEKFGFQIEGRLVQSTFRAGDYADVYAMARLRK